jgi:hypothetical protein
MRLAQPPYVEVIAAAVAGTAEATHRVAESAVRTGATGGGAVERVARSAGAPTQALPLGAAGSSPLTAAEELRVFDGLLTASGNLVPSGSGGEVVTDLANALAHQPRDPLVAAGYTVGMLIAAAGRAIGEQSGRRWLQLVSSGAGAAIGGASSALTGDVIGAIGGFLEVVADAADLKDVARSHVTPPRVPVLGDSARTEAALRALADVARRDPSALDPLIQCAAKQLPTLDRARA